MYLSISQLSSSQSQAFGKLQIRNEISRYLVRQTSLLFSYFFFFFCYPCDWLAVAHVCVCVRVCFSVLCVESFLSSSDNLRPGLPMSPFPPPNHLLLHLEAPSCESQVPCFTSVHRSLPGSFCIALFRFAVFRSVQFRWFIYLVFLPSSIIKLRLCTVRCFFIARQSEEEVRMRTCLKEPSMTMTTWTLWLWLWLIPRCKRTSWVRGTIGYRERGGGRWRGSN